MHLTVAGYLSTAGRAIEVDHARASVLAGWNPDETWWFRGVSPRPSEEQAWVRDDDGWKPAAG